MTDTTTTDASAIERARHLLGEVEPVDAGAPPPARPSTGAVTVPRPVAIVAAVVVLLIALSVLKMAWLSGPGDTTVNARIAPAPPTAVATATTSTTALAPSIPAASLVGTIGGATVNKTLGATVWPGAVLTAPPVRAGKATAWQWQTCSGPNKGCVDVDAITNNQWSAPPTTKQLWVKSIVTIQLGPTTTVRVGSAPVLVLPWPDGYSPKGKAPK